MTTRRAMSGVLDSFLGTYTSRYSSYDGYWLFGFLVAELTELRFNLLSPTPAAPASPLHEAIRIAASKFDDQLRKVGLARQHVREAWLSIQRSDGTATGLINGKRAVGHNVSFSAWAVTDTGRRFTRAQLVFVAPHNPDVELRSARTDSN